MCNNACSSFRTLWIPHSYHLKHPNRFYINFVFHTEKSSIVDIAPIQEILIECTGILVNPFRYTLVYFTEIFLAATTRIILVKFTSMFS